MVYQHQVPAATILMRRTTEHAAGGSSVKLLVQLQATIAASHPFRPYLLHRRGPRMTADSILPPLQRARKSCGSLQYVGPATTRDSANPLHLAPPSFVHVW